jgi:ABC-type glycerol-3-phosphate transport system permease component
MTGRSGEAVPLRRRPRGREWLIGRAFAYVSATLLALFILVPIYLIFISAITQREDASPTRRRSSWGGIARHDRLHQTRSG